MLRKPEVSTTVSVDDVLNIVRPFVNVVAKHQHHNVMGCRLACGGEFLCQMRSEVAAPKTPAGVGIYATVAYTGVM